MTSHYTQGLTVEVARARLTCGRTKFYSLCRSGHLKPIKIGKRTVIPEAQIEALLSTGAPSDLK